MRADWERYPFYLELLEEVKAHDERERHRSSSKKVAKLRLLSSGRTQNGQYLKCVSSQGEPVRLRHCIVARSLRIASYQRRGFSNRGC